VVVAGLTAAAVAAAGLSAAALAATTRAVNNRANEFSFSKKRLTAPKGRVTLNFRNAGAADHNIALRGAKLRRPVLGRVVGTGRTSRVSAVLKPGRYTFYCSVPGHEQVGMRGTLTVR